MLTAGMHQKTSLLLQICPDPHRMESPQTLPSGRHSTGVMNFGTALELSVLVMEKDIFHLDRG